MIKFALRRNLIYPLQFLIWNILRSTETYLISYFFDIGYLLIYTPLMFLGEILAGLIFYLYQSQFFFTKGIKLDPESNLTIEFLHSERSIEKEMGKKAIFLLLAPAFFDFVQFSLDSQMSKFINISGSLNQRIEGIFTINYALFNHYVLGLPILRHQFFSLIIIGICVTIIIIAEIIFQDINIFLTYGLFAIAFVYIILMIIFSTLMESVEKYLFEYERLNPFFVLMIEGICGFILTSIYCIFHGPFDEIIKFKKDKETYEFIILIFLLVLYMILSGGNNIFRVITIKIFSPVTSSLIYYILNPFYIIYYYISETDLKSGGKTNLTYFLINLIMSVILSFFNCVYNEFIILFCFGLERDTYSQITKRSNNEKVYSIMDGTDTQDSDFSET